MNHLFHRCLTLISLLVVVLGLASCHRSLEGTWKGVCTNVTHNITAPMELVVTQNGDDIRGMLAIHSDQLIGDGTLEGKVDGDEVIFWTTVITWTGELSNDGKTLRGEYYVPVTKEVGTFLIDRR